MRNDGKHINTLLDVQELVVSYYEKDILAGASINVMQGEIVTLIGTNGSGKSTLLKSIGGLVPPKAGQITFKGVDITGKSSKEIIRSGVGFLMQGNVIFPTLTINEHLQLALNAVNGVNLEERCSLVWELFPTLSKYRGKKAGFLSGGERQMLALSMLLVRDATLWLLDEPSGGLAPQLVDSIMNIIKKINVEKGITVLLVEQNLREGLRIADKAYVLKNGLTNLEENPKEILLNGRLEEIFF